jgi:hypothetical protein
MSDETMRAIDEQTAEQVEFLAHHYMVTVAEHLIREGIPVSEASGFAPHTDTLKHGEKWFFEAEGSIDFSPSFTRSLASDYEHAALHWHAASGWYTSRSRRIVGDPQSTEEVEDRWLGAGLVPPSERVLGFVLSAQMDFASAGSREQPYYREEASDYEPLIEQLAAYPPDSDEAFREHDDPDWRLATARNRICEQRAVAGLLTSGPDPVIELPIRRSELRALGHMLEHLEAVSGSGIVAALGRDLAKRAGADRDSANQYRSVLDEARYRSQVLGDGQQ